MLKSEIMKIIAIIPARFASTRFPGKPLALLGGKPMIQYAYESAVRALGKDCVAVATDDNRIFEAVRAFGGNVVMTSDKHRSGTDRVCEAYLKFAPDADIVINVQGDEPFLEPAQIHQLISCFDDSSTDIATLARKYAPTGSFEGLADPNTPKLVTDSRGFALYFSRSVIPYVRDAERIDWPSCHIYLTHIGVYAFRAKVLETVTSIAQTPLELAESLEQLRWLESGYKIRVGITDYFNIGIDTPSDLANAEKILRTRRNEDHA